MVWRSMKRLGDPLVWTSTGLARWFRNPLGWRSTCLEIQWFGDPVFSGSTGLEIHWFGDPLVWRSTRLEIHCVVVGMLQSMDVLSLAKLSTDGRHAAKHASVKALACTNSTTLVLCRTASVLCSTSAMFSAPTKVVTSWKHVTSN